MFGILCFLFMCTYLQVSYLPCPVNDRSTISVNHSAPSTEKTPKLSPFLGSIESNIIDRPKKLKNITVKDIDHLCHELFPNEQNLEIDEDHIYSDHSEVSESFGNNVLHDEFPYEEDFGELCLNFVNLISHLSILYTLIVFDQLFFVDNNDSKDESFLSQPLKGKLSIVDIVISTFFIFSIII